MDNFLSIVNNSALFLLANFIFRSKAPYPSLLPEGERGGGGLSI